jgi:flavin-binding protein dodecin
LPAKNSSANGERSRWRHFVIGLRREESLSFRMSNHIYKKIELVGSSPVGIEDAVQNALSKASKSLRNLRWFEVLETRGHIENDKIGHWQVTINVGFTLDD